MAASSSGTYLSKLENNAVRAALFADLTDDERDELLPADVAIRSGLVSG